MYNGTVEAYLSQIGERAMSDKHEPEFRIFVNNQEFVTHKHQLIGTEIKELASIPSDYELFEVTGDQTMPVGNEQSVHIHNNQHFRAIPAGTFGIYGSAA